MKFAEMLTQRQKELAQARADLEIVVKNANSSSEAIELNAATVQRLGDECEALAKAVKAMRARQIEPAKPAARRVARNDHLALLQKGMASALRYAAFGEKPADAVGAAIVQKAAVTADPLATNTTDVSGFLPQLFAQALPVLGLNSLYDVLVQRAALAGTREGDEIVFPQLVEADSMALPVHAEGEAIPVLAGQVATTKLKAERRAGIFTMTEEAIQRCRGLEALIFAGCQRATRSAIDAYLIAALKALSPVKAIPGTADAYADVSAGLGYLYDAFGEESAPIVAVSHTLWLKMQSQRDQVGNLKYPEAIARVLRGAALVPVATMAEDSALIIPTNNIVMPPAPEYRLTVSRDAVLHMDDKAPAKNLAGAQPVQSMFQTNCVALKVEARGLGVAALRKGMPGCVSITGANAWVGA